MSSKWTAQQVDGLITNVRADIKQFSSGGNTLDRENILDLISALDALRVENERLREVEIVSLEAEVRSHVEEIERLRKHLKRGQTLINDMDLRMPEQATEDAEGWINSYRISVGPWHRILGWARGGLPTASA